MALPYFAERPMAKRPKKKALPTGATPPARVERKKVPFTQTVDFRWACTLLQTALIVALGLWVYAPALEGDWVGDDRAYILQNPLLRDPAGLWKIWFAPGSYFEYYPLHATVQWIEWQLWGQDTLGYHVITLLLHLVGSLLVWRFLAKFGLRLAWLGGLLFALHPAQVESVAWMSELKNTLSLPPFLLAMGAYLDYEERGRRRDYWLAVGLFFVAMLCKISMALFPFVILLYAWWKRDRIGWRDLKACAPFLVISLALGLTNIFVADAYAKIYPMTVGATPPGGFLSRLAGAGLIFAVYFYHCIWPIGLMPHYPKWSVDPPSLAQFLPWPILIGILSWCWIKRATWGRHVILGLGFFLINLAPFLGFNRISFMRFTWVMDHFLYLPLLGLIALAVAGLGLVHERLPASLRPALIGAVLVIAALFAGMSRQYAAIYASEPALWAYAIERNPADWSSHTSLGNALVQNGDFQGARVQYEQALKIKPDEIDAHNDLGNVLFQAGQFAQARDQYETVLRLNPDFSEAHNNLGFTLAKLGRNTEAIEQYREVVRLDPSNVMAHSILGSALAQAGQWPEAQDEFEQALRLKSDFVDAHNNLGVVLARRGLTAQAIEQFQAALQIDPDNTSARDNLARLQNISTPSKPRP